MKIYIIECPCCEEKITVTSNGKVVTSLADEKYEPYPPLSQLVARRSLDKLKLP